MNQLIALVPALPVISALLPHLLAARLGRRVARLSVVATGMTFALTVVMLGLTVAGHGSEQIAAAADIGVLLSVPLSAVMAVLIAGISFIVHLYSERYMAEESGYARFFVLLDLMTASLLIMVAAGDLITLLAAWHMIGVLLYFLLGQDTRSPSAYRYAFWTFFTYRIGDLALVLAAALLYWAYGTWSLPAIFAHNGDVLHAIFLVGLVSAVIGAILMLTQNDIKKALGYSTMGQMGFMVMECGLGAFSLAIFHLIAHGMFKGTLFLGAGGVIGEARKDDGVPKDHLYSLVVEKRPARRRQPWLLMAAITLAVPVAVLVAAHWIVSDDFFQKQGAIV